MQSLAIRHSLAVERFLLIANLLLQKSFLKQNNPTSRWQRLPILPHIFFRRAFASIRKDGWNLRPYCLLTPSLKETLARRRSYGGSDKTAAVFIEAEKAGKVANGEASVVVSVVHMGNSRDICRYQEDPEWPHCARSHYCLPVSSGGP